MGELWFTGGVSNADSSVAGQLVTFSANARFWVLERVVLDLRAKIGFLSVTDDSLAQGEKVSARQTTAMVTLSWY